MGTGVAVLKTREESTRDFATGTKPAFEVIAVVNRCP